MELAFLNPLHFCGLLITLEQGLAITHLNYSENSFDSLSNNIGRQRDNLNTRPTCDDAWVKEV